MALSTIEFDKQYAELISRIRTEATALPRDTTIDYLREKSFWIAGVENDAVLKVIQRRLRDATAQGLTYRDWLKDMEDLFENLPANRPANVFGTNLYSA